MHFDEEPLLSHVVHFRVDDPLDDGDKRPEGHFLTLDRVNDKEEADNIREARSVDRVAVVI